MKITKNIITRQEAVAISPDYVAYAEGDHDKWDIVYQQFEKAKKGQKAITATRQDDKLIFVKVTITSVDHNSPMAVDGPVVRVGNNQYTWRVDGDRYAWLL